LKVLLGHGAEQIQATTDQREQTPAYIAMRKGHAECLKVLLEHSANPNFEGLIIVLPFSTQQPKTGVSLKHNSWWFRVHHGQCNELVIFTNGKKEDDDFDLITRAGKPKKKGNIACTLTDLSMGVGPYLCS